MTDFQKSKVYNAEFSVRRVLEMVAKGATRVEVANSTVTVPLEVRFGSLQGAQSYVNQVLDIARQQWPNLADVTVRPRKGATKAHYEHNTIAVHWPDDHGWAMREIVILHELAHHVARFDHHGPKFCGAFVWLVENIMGPETALLLRVAFADHDVKVNPVITRSN